MLAALLALSLCAACDSRRECEPISAPLDETSTACPRFGISTPGGPVAVDEYRAVTGAVGTAPGAVLWFVDFLSPPPLGALDIVRASGADPIVTWEPWLQRDDGTYDRTSISMTDIAAGIHDDHLYRWADELAAWDGTVFLRFAHEPNGDWYPWGPAGGTSAETYVAAWRHVHDLFASKGAVNVRWIWTVNVPHEGSSPIAPLYPGDGYVDVIGVDGYNWGTTRQWSRWQSPEDLFGPTFDELGRLAPERPVAVTEVASAEAGGSKPDWIRDLVAYLDSHPAVTTFVWFHHNKETDWRLTSTAECAAALDDALHRRHTAR